MLRLSCYPLHPNGTVIEVDAMSVLTSGPDGEWLSIETAPHTPADVPLLNTREYALVVLSGIESDIAPVECSIWRVELKYGRRVGGWMGAVKVNLESGRPEITFAENSPSRIVWARTDQIVNVTAQPVADFPTEIQYAEDGTDGSD